MTAVDIWHQFGDKLFGFIQKRVNDKHYAEDILQDVFVKIHEQDLTKIKQLNAWLFRITKNTIIDFYRKRKFNISLENELIAHNEETPINHELTSCLIPFIYKLNENYKDIITKVSIEGMSQKEYAEQHNMSYSTVKSRLQRARKKLKQEFINCCDPKSDKYGNIISTNHDNCAC